MMYTDNYNMRTSTLQGYKVAYIANTFVQLVA